ncbi:PREDICTED: urocanate hydratase [Amphimedon queenslandica]|uniref:Urocanate hydratase n=1 Tax=Amphimedon queenslandica TaxID=400682 RepID=A0A1X7VS19_AMPQE|nr:PREDICTED: urocanate hydratase [Amphimedon queenslandica]|eukprot:XP_003383059.1 PREDICTED: urocanate hydratase [Amphimedon queenslandica]
MAASLQIICGGLPLNPLPHERKRSSSLPHAPVRNPKLTQSEKRLALKNSLRYFPVEAHSTLAPEFLKELETYGHIYMYRFIPPIDMKAYPVEEYPVKCPAAAAIMHMIMNNLNPKVAQFPEELVTYGGNGQVLSNWAQFWLLMNYLSNMNEEQTLVMYSGHPMGLFPSYSDAPRLVITNGMVIPNYSSREEYEKFFALGVTMFGQMTAGSYCYIGPQGIVHGTTLTVLNAGRKYLGSGDLSGKVFITSGLGGMSGAQAKAAVISGCVGVIAEVNKDALLKRYEQGWLMKWTDDLEDCIKAIKTARSQKAPLSLGYHGNIVSLWERMVEEYKATGELIVELGSDQTSLHNPFGGGYYPAQLSYSESQEMLKTDPERFKSLVQESLRRQVKAINALCTAGMRFWDYGNAFLLESGRAGADIKKENGEYKYPSYVQDIMGDIFSLGFGPFRWVCTSGLSSDLAETDAIALRVLQDIMKRGIPDSVHQQYEDNSKWIKEAGKHEMVVGSQARILYSDDEGRIEIALGFNTAISEGRIKGPVVISRDHHDVSGTDSPFRETSNIEDGSKFCADMAIQNVIGGSFRGATWVAIHNGGGVGWGEVINGGFGLVLDGTQEAAKRAQRMLYWDVMNGVCRRAWSGHPLAQGVVERAERNDPLLKVTKSNDVLDTVLNEAITD